MSAEELIQEIKDMRILYVMSRSAVPHYVSINQKTRNKIASISSILDMEILVDDYLKDDEIRLLRK